MPLIYVAVVSSYPSIIKMTDWKAMTEPTERIVLTMNKRISVTRVAVAILNMWLQVVILCTATSAC